LISDYNRSSQVRVGPNQLDFNKIKQIRSGSVSNESNVFLGSDQILPSLAGLRGQVRAPKSKKKRRYK
jgi:hypothetical protein